MRGVLDTSTVILLSQIRDADQIPNEPAITAISLAELAVGPLATDDEHERARRQAHLQLAESEFDPIPFDAAAAGRSARSRARFAALAESPRREPSTL